MHLLETRIDNGTFGTFIAPRPSHITRQTEKQEQIHNRSLQELEIVRRFYQSEKLKYDQSIDCSQTV